MDRALRVMVICKSGRLDCILDALSRSPKRKALFVLSEVNNPSLEGKAERVQQVQRTDDADIVVKYAREFAVDFVVIGPEEPLCAAVVDALKSIGVPAVGPTQSLARIETSKLFARELLKEFNIPGNPSYRVFDTSTKWALPSYLRAHDSFVVKPDGLTSGKGVKVYPEHFDGVDDAASYCNSIIDGGSKVLIEERLEGEEFSFQSFCDGTHLVHMPPVQDHKRAWEDDKGPNTGGMGSYSCENHLLPFLSERDILEAKKINELVARALFKKTGEYYKGILYGSYMLTKHGLRVIEFNARFGDPEVMNVLSILETDFIEICQSIINGTLDKVDVRFGKLATVCKYIVPDGYPTNPAKGEELYLDKLPPSGDQLKYYYGAINSQGRRLVLTGSRALAIVGIAPTLADAERLAESAAVLVQGPVFHRKDIGTARLVSRRVAHMAQILGSKPTAHSA